MNTLSIKVLGACCEQRLTDEKNWFSSVNHFPRIQSPEHPNMGLSRILTPVLQWRMLMGDQLGATIGSWSGLDIWLKLSVLYTSLVLPQYLFYRKLIRRHVKLVALWVNITCIIMCYSMPKTPMTIFCLSILTSHACFKVSLPCEKPWIGLFSERVLGLICLWSTGAIVVGCPSWQHQWPW